MCLCRSRNGARDKLAGFTLVELLVASTIALAVMGALASLFGVFSRSSSSLQSLVDMTTRMRIVSNELRSDLYGITCELNPPISPESDSGYFELIEGPMQDAITYDTTTGQEFAKPYLTGTPYIRAERGTGQLLGDVDDVLALTTRSLAEPFTGRCYLLSSDTTPIYTISGSTNPFYTIQSRTAEVVWFLQKSVTQVGGYDVYDLCRRQLLVLPCVGVPPFTPVVGSGSSAQLTTGTATTPIGTIYSGVNQLSITPWTASTWTDYFGGFNSNGARFFYDVSVRRQQGGGVDYLVPNSLGDLTKRENRFWRWTPSSPFLPTFPHAFLWADDAPSPGFNIKVNPVTGMEINVQRTIRQGEDVVLRNVISFDLRVFDPDAPIKKNPAVGIPLGPGDPGYNDPNSYLATYGSGPNNRPVRGAYVDLGWDFGRQAAADFVFPIDPSLSNSSSLGFINTFPGREDRHQLPAAGGSTNPDDSNGNARLDSLTAFQGLGMQPWNKPLSYPSSLPSILTKPPVSYCTWSTHYESNGLDENSRNGPDEGTNGVDDSSPADGIPDDPTERETSPPYPVRLRGLEVRIRCIDPTTKQIRQTTIRHAFDQY